MACLSCLGVMFVGSRFCDRCGAIAAPIGLHEDEGRDQCPTCRLVLTRVEISGVNLFECTQCGGLWADIETFESLFLDGEKQTAVLRFVRDRKIRSEVLTKTRHVPCPYCHVPMVRNVSAHEAGVILDICNKHGAWFDPDEFPKIVKFVLDGSTANPKLNEKLEIASERDRLRHEHQGSEAPIQNSEHGGGIVTEDNFGIRDFVRNLFA